MIRPFLLVLPLLAACEGAEVVSPAQSVQGGGGETGQEPPATNEPTERIAMAQTGWLTIGRDGSVYTTQFDADGTYRDYRNGEFVQAGTWRRSEDGSLCFSPAAMEQLGTCWDTQGLEEDGTMRALDRDGRAIALRRVSYLPPAAIEEDVAGESGGEDAAENGTES